MDKYISADYLKERIQASPLFINFGEDGFFFRDFFMDLVNRQPVIDAVQVVRCKDCKYCEVGHSTPGVDKTPHPFYVCKCRYERVLPGGYCSRGVAKK